jgi:hypothetical protein
MPEGWLGGGFRVVRGGSGWLGGSSGANWWWSNSLKRRNSNTKNDLQNFEMKVIF